MFGGVPRSQRSVNGKSQKNSIEGQSSKRGGCAGGGKKRKKFWRSCCSTGRELGDSQHKNDEILARTDTNQSITPLKVGAIGKSWKVSAGDPHGATGCRRHFGLIYRSTVEYSVAILGSQVSCWIELTYRCFYLCFRGVFSLLLWVAKPNRLASNLIRRFIFIDSYFE